MKGIENLTSKENLREQWKKLHALDDASQERGYQLEELILELLKLEELNPAPPYKGGGEQIDGFFEMEGRYFLVEMKWSKEPLPASEVYAFRAKVDGKLVGTVGVFIAINGFSEDAPEALRYGKEINVLLFNGQDIDFALMDEYSFRQILKVKLRYAAQYGGVNYTYERYLKDEVIP
ncbi:restriction endonuclease [Candidatus Poribacteria bacterium]|nr:restriction endonuclease [Candidatus Poribacteria bacterium]